MVSASSTFIVTTGTRIVSLAVTLASIVSWHSYTPSNLEPYANMTCRTRSPRVRGLRSAQEGAVSGHDRGRRVLRLCIVYFDRPLFSSSSLYILHYQQRLGREHSFRLYISRVMTIALQALSWKSVADALCIGRIASLRREVVRLLCMSIT